MKEHFSRVALVITVLIATMTGCSSDQASVIEDSDARRIVRLDVESANVYVIEENDRRLMIDAGNPGDEERYEALMQEVGIDPATIDYAILTHGHIDHAGTAASFQQRYGIQLIGGADDQAMIDAGGEVDYCPTSMTARYIRMTIDGSHYPVFKLDRAIDMDGAAVDLAELGMSGKILPHPGHTPGSVVILIGRHAFVGDLIRGGIVANETPTTHFFMCDLEENRRRIGEILQLHGIEQWHPGHFGSFPAEAVRAYLAKEIGD
jgi:glyoxylase-like metal-dependent hydrolase (beta-lactamase superfamily II)